MGGRQEPYIQFRGVLIIMCLGTTVISVPAVFFSYDPNYASCMKKSYVT